MIYDASRARLYVSAGAQATANANTIEMVDAIGETIASTIPIGNDPGPLALSDDSSTLWVGLTGDHAIRSVDLTTATPTVNPEHQLPAPSVVSPAQARTLVVLPGTRTTVVASISGVIYVFDDGVARANHGGSVIADRVAVGPTGYVFGDNTETTGYDFTSFAISASGAQMVADVQGLMLSNVDDIIYWSSRVYGYWGEATDVSDPTKPKRAGKFDFQGAIAGRDATHLLMMSWSSLIGANTPQAIRVLDTTTFTQTASVTVPTTLISNATELLDLCYLGGDRVAFLTQDYNSSNRLFFIETPVIAQ
jgi:DNA-binding beta-propeller fold protein YncE